MARDRYVKLFLILLLVSGITACIRQLPAFQREAKRQDAIMTRETVEAIKKFPVLQELDKLCTQEIPRPDGFVFTHQSWDFHENRWLVYHYRSKDDYKTVKQFYMTYFAKQGWRITNQKDEGWGPSRIEFGNEKYRVKIEDLTGLDGPSYAVLCEKL